MSGTVDEPLEGRGPYVPRFIHQLVYPRLSTASRKRIKRLSRRLYNSLMVPRDIEFTIVVNRKRIALNRPGCAFALQSMYSYGYERSPWEREVRTLMERLFRRGPATFFDIGANVGIYTYMACAQSDIRTHAFEPLPVNVEYIRNTVTRNGLTQVTVAPLALGDTSGSATFYVPIVPSMPEGYNADMSSLINRFEGSNRRHRGLKARQITVPVGTLDEYVVHHGIDVIDIIKLDVEEAELQVLHGAARTLERMGPDITCELLFDNPNAGEIFRGLASLGYSGYLITKFGLIAESEPLMIRQRGGNERLAIWNDHFFSRRRPAEIRRLSTEAFGGFDAPAFHREVERGQYIVG